MDTYYKSQLEKITVPLNLKGISLKIQGDKETNWIGLNQESATQIVNWLTDNFGVITEPSKHVESETVQSFDFSLSGVGTRYELLESLKGIISLIEQQDKDDNDEHELMTLNLNGCMNPT